MIPPVNKEELRRELEDEDEEIYRARPQWFKFFYAAWLLSTSSMDAEQRGWYIQMLTYAAELGDFPGYLPDDEDDLKEIAGFLDLPGDMATLFYHGASIPAETLDKLKEARQLRWQKVRRKFISAIDDKSGYVYNKRLLNALKDAYRKQLFAVEAGKLRQKDIRARKRAKRRETKEILATAERGSANGQNIGQNSPLIGEVKSGDISKETNEMTATAQPSRLSSESSYINLEEEYVIEKDTSQDKEVLDLVEIREIKTSTSILDLENFELVPLSASLGITSKRKGRRALPETLFNEDRFDITEKMKSHLLTKYPEFDQGDLNWLEDKFKNVYHGTRYSSWSRAFYNFIDNQVVKYNYKPGSYNWRNQQSKGQNNGQAIRGETSGSSGRTTFESASERNARLEQEADHYTRQLQGGNSNTHPQNPPWLSLTTDAD